MELTETLTRLHNGLIVSCQALEDEPLHSSYIMSRMALAAKNGGAVGIRANGNSDIKSIKAAVDLPIIGLVKKKYIDSEVFITPTMDEVDEVIKAGAEIIATDATNRTRPGNINLKTFFNELKNNYPTTPLMADISTYQEAAMACELGFDLISTTLSGFTEYTINCPTPNLKLIQKIAKYMNIPVVAEGGIWELRQMKAAFEYGAFSCVIGSAITRPQEITKRFVDYIPDLTFDKQKSVGQPTIEKEY